MTNLIRWAQVAGAALGAAAGVRFGLRYVRQLGDDRRRVEAMQRGDIRPRYRCPACGRRAVVATFGQGTSPSEVAATFKMRCEHCGRESFGPFGDGLIVPPRSEPEGQEDNRG